MNDDTLNMSIRKFLKQVGITSQREIEYATLKAIDSGLLNGTKTLEVHMSLTVPELQITHKIDGQIELE